MIRGDDDVDQAFSLQIPRGPKTAR